MFKKKSKIDTTNLISLVITDDEQVAASLKRILTSVHGNWKVYTCKGCYSFSPSKLGVREDFTLELKFKDEFIKKIATASSEIFIATLPDNKGYYNKYKIYTYLKYIKISVPIYDFSLPFISDESVFHSLMNKKRMSINSKKILRYESRLAIDRLIKFHTNELFKKIIPVEPDLESNTVLILNYIDSLGKTQYVKYSGLYDFFTLSKNETLDKSFSYEFKKLKKVITLSDLLTYCSKVNKWIGSVKSLVELYAKGYLSYPTNSTSSKYFVTDSSKGSNKSWGIYSRKDLEVPLSDNAKDILSSYKLLSSVKYKQELTINNHVLTNYVSTKKESNVKFLNQKSLGVSQKELASYFTKIKLPSKLWVYQVYTLVKHGLIVEISDTNFCITALGKLVLYIVKNKIPRLLNEKSVTRINEGIAKITDEESRFDFLTDRWDRVNIEIQAIEDFELPRVKTKCSKCGTRLSLNITDKNVFVRCQNPKCSKDDMIPIVIKNNKIFAKE